MLVKAHAKINLALDVLGTRLDGYHELETVMQTLDLHDRIELSPAPVVELVVYGADLPRGPQNLARRAADLLKERTGYHGGALIKLHKKIPLAAGLAGGSADAAAVLRGLNQLWNLGLTMEELSSLGAEIGSDVPFCLRGGTALARGRGEIIAGLPDLPSVGVLLVKPPFGVDTAEVYRRYDRLPGPGRPGCAKMLAAVGVGDIGGVAANLCNALEPVTLAMHSAIGQIKAEVAAAGALGVLMSGSGPTVFGVFRNAELAGLAAGKINRGDRWVRAAVFVRGTD
ncbi:MAG: 4-(cytidine 5'-diphospho)-2-C-methyl-D-erythritol kinase [Firmicutes bacterium]|nr:4-(cytidine 5'-diphospho)-2-C-methyl-D-erythritol kinase [Bacillota bacterium]